MSQINALSNEAPIYSIPNHEPIPIKATYVVERKGLNKCLKLSLLLCILFIIFIIISTVVSIALIFGTPQAIKSCSENATLVNGKCRCIYGFNGDGDTYCDECGVTSVNPNLARIVGGVKADPYSWPSTVLIHFNYKGDIKLPTVNGVGGEIVTVRLASKCGGTLIDRTTVMTAGHCIIDKIRFTYNDEKYVASIQPTMYYKTIESMYSVYAGVYRESDTLEKDIPPTSPIIKRTAAKLIRHEDYDDNTKVNDIALIKFNEPIELTREVQVACLPQSTLKKYPIPNEKCWTVGWGKLTEDGEQPDELYNVKLTTYNSTFCRTVAFGVPKNWDAQLCAGEYLGGKDSCQGDSGGSLFIEEEINNSTKYVSAGIVSYGDGCAIQGKPGIYTRTSYYLDWIYNNK